MLTKREKLSDDAETICHHFRSSRNSNQI